MTKLGLRRRQEQYDALLELNDRDLCEMIRAHFASHPCISGEKALKDAAGQYLAMNDPNLSLSPEDREAYAHNFAATRIRETKLEYATMSSSAVHEAWANDAQIDPETPGNMTRILNVTLAAKPSGKVAVLLPGDQYRELGELPESFVRNNPMNVQECSAEMEISDYSAGKGTTMGVHVVVDTDLMSGDVLDLNAEDLAELSEDYNLEK